VPMGGELAAGSGAPTFLLHAEADRIPLERLQIIKGWYQADGRVRERVYDVAVADGAPSVDLETCAPSTGTGFTAHCAVWTDPEFDASEPAFYYARVIENPTCRWSTRECLAFAPDDRPDGCDAPAIPATVQQRAWSSPIWHAP
jgi:hypothetical protein